MARLRRISGQVDFPPLSGVEHLPPAVIPALVLGHRLNGAKGARLADHSHELLQGRVPRGHQRYHPELVGHRLEAPLVPGPPPVIIEHVGHRHRPRVENHVEGVARQLHLVRGEPEPAELRHQGNDPISDDAHDPVSHHGSTEIGKGTDGHPTQQAQIVEISD